jgi:hypothetical protein
MVNMFINNEVLIPSKKIVISNYVLLKFKGGEITIGIDKEDILQWVKDMEKPNEVN